MLSSPCLYDQHQSNICRYRIGIASKALGYLSHGCLVDVKVVESSPDEGKQAARVTRSLAPASVNRPINCVVFSSCHSFLQWHDGSDHSTGAKAAWDLGESVLDLTKPQGSQ